MSLLERVIFVGLVIALLLIAMLQRRRKTMTPTETIHRFAVQNMLVERYLLGELGGADLEDFERHMFECSICFEDVRAGQVVKQGIAATNGKDREARG